MQKQILLRFQNNDYEQLQLLASLKNVSVPKLIKQIVYDSLRQDARDTSLLAELIQSIERLNQSLLQHQIQPVQSVNPQIEKWFRLLFEVMKLIVFKLSFNAQERQQLLEQVEKLKNEILNT